MAHYRGVLCHEGDYNLRCSEQQQMQRAKMFSVPVRCDSNSHPSALNKGIGFFYSVNFGAQV